MIEMNNIPIFVQKINKAYQFQSMNGLQGVGSDVFEIYTEGIPKENHIFLNMLSNEISVFPTILKEQHLIIDGFMFPINMREKLIRMPYYITFEHMKSLLN